MLRHAIFSRFQKISFFRLALLSLTLLDELMVGFALEAGLPLLRDQVGLSYEQVGFLFSIGAVSALLLEPIINLLSDRTSKRWWVLGGLLSLALGYGLAGSTHNYIVLLIAFALIYPASGAAVGLSEAALIDDAPHAATRTMTRWTLIASIGDLLSPLVVAAFVALSLGWSELCWFAVIAWTVAALMVGLQRFPRPACAPDNDTSDASILANLRKAIRDPLLLRWAVLAILPFMLDEVFTGFSVLYLRDVLHADQVVISMSIVAQMIGALLGLLIVDRLVGHIAPQQLLVWLSLLSLTGIIILLSIHITIVAIGALFTISLGAAGLYPIAQAEAYARQPGRSGMVRAIIGLGTPFEIALPGLVGLVAGHFGVLTGVALLGTAPLLILLLAPKHT
ncbi:MAG: MFS transporter [Chloroflexi bacterium]|nr:MAG: MFS transporter [Chloroflexota bacterium]